MKKERSFSSQTLPPYLGVPQFDIRPTVFGLGVRQQDTSIHFYCSTKRLETSGPSPPRPPEHNSRGQISAMKRGGRRGYTRHVWATHTHTCVYTLDRQALQTYTHTHTYTRETYLVEVGQMFYLSVCVCQSAPLPLTEEC